MNSKNLLLIFKGIILAFCVSVCSAEDYCSKDSCQDANAHNFPEKPNFIIILADDLGYGDLSSYGHPTQEWGPVDQMAAEGLRFTQFYAADSLCTPSRAGLLTGRLPVRLGIFNRPKRCLHPPDKGGLPREEKTIPEYLSSLGYRTGMVGKWHLGINAINSSDGTHLPVHRFQYVGTNIPYTVNWDCDETGVFAKNGPNTQKCFLYNGDKIVQQPIKFETLTARLVRDFKTFVDSTGEDPFFFYFSLPQVHVNLFASRRFNGSSMRGLYGDNLNEMAWSVGQVLEYLKEKDLHEKTLVLFLSDHGAHEELCQLGGVSGFFSGGKSHMWEGGFRIPAISWLPGTIRPGSVSSSVMSSLDLLPSFLKMAGGAMPEEKTDGVESVSCLLGQEVKRRGPEEERRRLILFYCNDRLMAVRFGKYKIHFMTIPLKPVDREMQCPGGIHIQNWYLMNRCPESELVKEDPPLIFDLERDPEEWDKISPSEVWGMMEEVEGLLSDHRKNLVVGEMQHGFWDDSLIPCCDPPHCKCDKLTDQDL